MGPRYTSMSGNTRQPKPHLINQNQSSVGWPSSDIDKMAAKQKAVAEESGSSNNRSNSGRSRKRRDDTDDTNGPEEVVEP